MLNRPNRFSLSLAFQVTLLSTVDRLKTNGACEKKLLVAGTEPSGSRRFGSGIADRRRCTIGSMRSAGMTLPGNAVRPAPLAAPVSGS